jgi:predicted metal-dependent hydrolase
MGLPERAPSISYAESFDADWAQSSEFAFAANGISLIMPFAEPYFVRSIRAVVPQLDDALAGQTREYLRQELQHHVKHREFNRLITAQYPGVLRVEDQMRRTYAWLGKTRSSRFNVAFAAGSETIAFAIARWTEAHLSVFDGADPAVATLFAWHLAEEAEHASAAYDVFEATDGNRWRYLAAASTSLLILLWFVWRATLSQLRATHRLWSPLSHLRLARWSVSLGFTILPLVFASAMPSHHPSQFAGTTLLEKWLSYYDVDTKALPEWPTGTNGADRAPRALDAPD